MDKRGNEMRTLVGNIHTSHRERDATLEKLCEDVHSKLQEFHSDHKQMATELQNRLRTIRPDLRDTVSAMRKEFQAENQAAHEAWFGSKSRR